jgi:hypothetical protein
VECQSVLLRGERQDLFPHPGGRLLGEQDHLQLAPGGVHELWLEGSVGRNRPGLTVGAQKHGDVEAERALEPSFDSPRKRALLAAGGTEDHVAAGAERGDLVEPEPLEDAPQVLVLDPAPGPEVHAPQECRVATHAATLARLSHLEGVAIVGFSILGGVMACLSGSYAARSLAAGEPSDTLARRINEGIARGFTASRPASVVAALIMLWT